MKRFLVFSGVLITAFFSSCVPHKDTVYLQVKEAALDTTQIITEVQKPYRVQINDILNISVKALDQDNIQIFNPAGESNLTASSEERAYFDGFTVDLHGEIRIPLLGKVNVLGYTTEEIEQILEAKLLKEQFKETANIFVTVKLTGLRYSTNGEIGNSGSQVLYQERVNIFQAIGEAGEINDTGDRKDVLIIRQYPQGQQIHHLDLTDINIMKSPYYYIQPNDMIYVKPLKVKALGAGTNALQNITSVLTVVTLITTTILLFKL